MIRADFYSYEVLKMIKQGDCLELMKEIPASSVDMILTDLPYNTTDCAWDKSVIDLDALWIQFKRVLKHCCSTVLFASGKFTYKLIASNFDQYKYKWIWVKNTQTNFVHAKNAPMHKFEEVLVFSDGAINHASCTNRRMKYNPQGVVSCDLLRTESGADKPSQLRAGGRGENWRQNYNWERNYRKNAFGGTYGARPSHVDYYIQEQTGYPSDILEFAAESNGGRLHPTQKPVDLLEYLIKTYTNEGETVLDATMGSGSTGVAAINTGRKFIGIEKEQNFFEISEKRITEAIAKKEQSLF